jgi:2,4-dienoyl-CoA reductase-like NADH-dependent reductase (Old Yellow Enzyme family)
MRKELERSGKTLKEGHNQIASNIKEMSAGVDREEPPAPNQKKVTTESKKNKAPISGNKSKTEVKETTEVVEEKAPLVSAARRSTRRSNQPEEIKEKENEGEKPQPSKKKIDKKQ